MTVYLKSDAFDPYRELQDYQDENLPAEKYGATSCFIGTMRNFNQDAAVTAMTLEHYPGMTEAQLEKICVKANQKWTLIDTLVIHRTGSITPDMPIVLIAVWSAHRHDALNACQFLIEQLKSEAPFWKKETLQNGEKWVEKNTGN